MVKNKEKTSLDAKARKAGALMMKNLAKMSGTL